MIIISQSADVLLLSQLIPNASAKDIAITIKNGVRVSLYNDCALPEQAIECILEDNAQLHMVHHQWQAYEYANTTYNFFLGYKSTLNHTLVATGAQQAAVTVNLVLQKPYAHAQLFGAYALANTQQLTLTTTQEHQAPYTTSNLIYKGLLAGACNARYEGLITIGEHATGSDANQQNKNLLLSADAKAVSVPSLQALTNNIACKHGSAIGRLDEQQVWYLQSRGIPHDAARSLLIKAFLFDALRGITDEKQIHKIQNEMVQKI